MLRTVLAVAEPSKVPFFVMGGVLAAWAVVLAGVGLTHPSFPFGERGARGVMLFSFVLVLATLASAVLTDK